MREQFVHENVRQDQEVRVAGRHRVVVIDLRKAHHVVGVAIRQVALRDAFLLAAKDDAVNLLEVREEDDGFATRTEAEIDLVCRVAIGRAGGAALAVSSEGHISQSARANEGKRRNRVLRRVIGDISKIQSGQGDRLVRPVVEFKVVVAGIWVGQPFVDAEREGRAEGQRGVGRAEAGRAQSPREADPPDGMVLQLQAVLHLIHERLRGVIKKKETAAGLDAERNGLARVVGVRRVRESRVESNHQVLPAQQHGASGRKNVTRRNCVRVAQAETRQVHFFRPRVKQLHHVRVAAKHIRIQRVVREDFIDPHGRGLTMNQWERRKQDEQRRQPHQKLLSHNESESVRTRRPSLLGGGKCRKTSTALF